MIKFFNKIRQNLLAENKTGKYLKYAIGEIVLVVIGILIALSINNWNEGKANRTFEMKMLKEIVTALEEDHRFFTEHLLNNRNKTELEAIAFFDKAILFKKSEVDSVNFHFNRLDYGIRVTCNSGPYDALKVAGIDKISNDSLRNKLIYFYDFIIPRYLGIIEYSKESSRELMIPLIEQLGTTAPPIISMGTVVRSDLILKDIDIRENEDFNRLLYLTNKRARNVKSVLEAITPYMEELIKLIENEIQN
jgi:hypothetical protein